MQKIGRNDPCWCGSGHKYKNCHMDFDVKLSEYRHKGSKVPSHAMIKNPEQIAAIRESAKINVSVLDYVAEHICAGISTEQIDLWVYEQTTHRGGIPAPLNYEGFPKSVCTSVNDQVCHGIPSADVILKDGDIINVDVSTIIKDTTPTLPECSVSVKSPLKEASGRGNQTGDRRRFKTGTAMGTLR